MGNDRSKLPFRILVTWTPSGGETFPRSRSSPLPHPSSSPVALTEVKPCSQEHSSFLEFSTQRTETSGTSNNGNSKHLADPFHQSTVSLEMASSFPTSNVLPVCMHDTRMCVYEHLYVHMCGGQKSQCMYICVPHTCLVPVEIRREHQIPQNLVGSPEGAGLVGHPEGAGLSFVCAAQEGCVPDLHGSPGNTKHTLAARSPRSTT